MQQMEISDYINDQPRPRQKRSGDANQTGDNTYDFIVYLLLNYRLIL